MKNKYYIQRKWILDQQNIDENEIRRKPLKNLSIREHGQLRNNKIQ